MFLMSFAKAGKESLLVKSKIFFVISTVLTLMIAGLIFSNLERYTETLNYGWGPEAKRNAYLAAQTFLKPRSDSLENLSRFQSVTLDSSYTTLIIPDPSYVYMPSHQKEILDWVARGGHLIIGVGRGDEPPVIHQLGYRSTYKYNYDSWDGYDSEGDSLAQDSSKADSSREDKSLADVLKEFNLEAQKQIDQKAKEDSLALEKDSVVTDTLDSAVVNKPICMASYIQCDMEEEPDLQTANIIRVRLPGSKDSMQINLSSYRYIAHGPKPNDEIEGLNEDEERSEQKESADSKETATTEPDSIPNPYAEWAPFYTVEDENGIYFAQSKYEQGKVSVLADFDIWRNSEAVHFDHVYFLSLLVGSDQKILFINGKNVPSLDVVVYNNFSEALLAIAVLIVLTLIYYGRRFGAIRFKDDEVRRSRSEQFLAQSQFRWLIKNEEDLYHHIRDDIRKRAEKHWKDFLEWSENKQNSHLATMCDLPLGTIEKVMHGQIPLQETQFTDAMRALQILRKSL